MGQTISSDESAEKIAFNIINVTLSSKSKKKTVYVLGLTVRNDKYDTAWKVSVIGVILVRIFPHSDWIRRG